METKKVKILEISKKLGLSHIGSCLSVLPILEEIYSIKKPLDFVLMDGAHAHLAHLIFNNPDHAEEMIHRYGIHCDRQAGCDISGGSLGHAGGIAIGLALVFKTRDIYVIFTDGGMQEGSNWEALRIMKELSLKNIKCYFNFNDYTALQKTDTDSLSKMIYSFCPTGQIRLTKNGRGYEGVKGHYIKIK